MSRILVVALLVGCSTSGLDNEPVFAPPEVAGNGGFDLDPGQDHNDDTADKHDPLHEQADPEVCYPAVNETWDLCYDLFVPRDWPSGYAYPEPLNGSAQYATPTALLDLSTLDGADKLAPNFRLDEIAQLWKGRYAVIQPHAIGRVQALRDQLGPLVVNSGYRSPDYNTSVDGATHSRHMYGDAFDLDPVSVSLSMLADTCYDHGAGYVGVYTAHVHCDWRNEPLDDEFFLVYRGLVGSVPLPQLDAEVLWADGVLMAPAHGWDEGEPLREWTAYDLDGNVMSTLAAETFVPPPGAYAVDVRVGMAIARAIDL